MIGKPLLTLSFCMLFVGFSAFVHAKERNVDLCTWMWGYEVKSLPESLHDVRDKIAAGDLRGAYASFVDLQYKLDEEAMSVFFLYENRDDFSKARGFIDRWVIGPGAILAARGDTFTLRSDYVALAAWLACEAGQEEQSLNWLRLGWRDHRQARFHADFVFASLAFGSTQEVESHLGSAPPGAVGQISKGVWACASGRREGSDLLTAILPTVTDPKRKKALEDVISECSKLP